MGIADEKYVAVTTTKRSGDTVSTPVWIVETADGRIGFITEADSGKVKRTVVRGDDVALFAEALRAKYGLMVPLIELGYKVRNLVKRRPPSDEVAVELQLR